MKWPVAAFMNPSPPAAHQSAPPTKRRFDFGQFVSRTFNFVYVLVSCFLLVLAPFAVNNWNIGARALWLLGAMLGDLILVQGFKHLFYVPRPHTPGVFSWGRRAHSGFPSGHTLPAFLLATLIAQAHPKLGFWFAGALLIAWARWRVKAHFAYQVTLSALMGIGLGLLAGRWL